MKKNISTMVITTVILDSAKSKLNMAINHSLNKIIAWEWMQKAKNDLFLLETIFYCEKEYEMERKVYAIRKKLADTKGDDDDVKQVSEACYHAIKGLDQEIFRLTDQA